VGEVLAPLSMCRSTTVPQVNSSSSSSWSVESEAGGCEDVISPGVKKTWSLSGYMFVLVVAHMLHGAGATPIYTLAVTYLDDNLKAKVTPLYLGTYLLVSVGLPQWRSQWREFLKGNFLGF